MNTDPRSTVDAYLTRIARKAWPNASVTVRLESSDSKYYQLEVPGEKPFVLGNVFGPARMMLRAIVLDHLPPEANRAHFIFDVPVIDDARKPGIEDLARATQIGVSLRDESSSRADAELAGKLLALGVGGGAFTIEDILSLRKHGIAKGSQRSDYEQLADALVYWCDIGV
jgi:hypothetical protein